VSTHALIRGEVARDLEELDADQHGHPCQLESGPNGKYDGERIFVEDFAEFRREDGALRVFFGCFAYLQICG